VKKKREDNKDQDPQTDHKIVRSLTELGQEHRTKRKRGR